jgi:hypothetical protein
LTISFLVIGPHLSWHVGVGTLVRIDIDAIMGCNRDIILLEELVTHLRDWGNNTLNTIDKPLDTTLWRKGWMISTYLGLTGD